MAKISYEKLISCKLDILKNEYKKLVALPPDEFLSPENVKSREELRHKILEIIKGLPNKPEQPASTHFAKHYQVEEADLYENQCAHCKKIFAMDYKYCPYCGELLLWHV